MLWGKGSTWWKGLYFYNMKDQKVPSPVQIPGVVAVGMETSPGGPVYRCTPQCGVGYIQPVREADLEWYSARPLPRWQDTESLAEISPSSRASRQGYGQCGMTCLLCHSLVCLQVPRMQSPHAWAQVWVPRLSAPGSTATPRKFWKLFLLSHIFLLKILCVFASKSERKVSCGLGLSHQSCWH